MDDKQLLEAAARAAGMPVLPEGPWPAGAYGWFYNAHGGGGMFLAGVKVQNSRWNPLTDDGDALRLAVKLGICVAQEPRNGAVFCDVANTRIEADEEYGSDPYAATRRAIVRAAASLGEAK